MFYQSDVFSITAVRVVGAERLSNKYLEQLAAVPGGSTLLRVDIDGISKRLTDDSWIAEVSVERSFPSTLIITIKERTPVAVVETYPDLVSSETVPWLISGDGIWLGNADGSSSEVVVTAEELASYCPIIGVQRDIVPVYGRKNTDEGVQNALAILARFSPEMRSLLKNINAPDSNQTMLILKNNVEVLFGSAKDTEAKEIAIKTLLNEHPDTLISMNVRVADTPSWKAL